MFHKNCFLNNPQDISLGNGISFLHRGNEFPFPVPRNCGNGNTPRNVRAFRGIFDKHEGTLYTVIKLLNHPGSQFDTQGFSSADNPFSRHNTGGFLIDLNGSRISLNFNDLSDEAKISHPNHIIHARPGHPLGNNERA